MLGLCGVAEALIAVTGKGEWGGRIEQHEVFEELKWRMTEEPVLIIPRNNDKF